MKKESIDQTIEQLGGFLDHAMSMAVFDSVFGTESFTHARLTFPRLNRVRRLLGEIEEQRMPHYSLVFRSKLIESATGYTEARIAHFERIDTQPVRSEPTVYDRKRALAGAAVYILTEWDDPDALNEFLAVLDRLDLLPVNRLFLLYSAHLIIESLSICQLRGQ